MKGSDWTWKIRMLLTVKSVVCSNIFSYHHQLLEKNGRILGTAMAKKRDLSENSRTQQEPILPLRVTNTVLARSAIAVFGLGFIDAGYSGDWSRIGVISRESEDVLKLAAFVVVPLCLFVIFSVSRKHEA